MSLFLLSMACFSATLSVVGNLVNVNVPKPYMDEIFHIPQAQKYCEKDFTSWDPKITTLPGLYLISVGIVSPLNSVASILSGEPPDQINTCSTSNLRSLNLIFGLVNLALTYCITEQLHGEKHDYKPNLAVLNSINLSLLPVLFMFNLLYYTDTVSTMMVLLTYSLHLAEHPYLSSLAGLCAVLCRQTNIVWVFLVAALRAGDHWLEEVQHLQAKLKRPTTIALTTYGQAVELLHGSVHLLQCPWRAAKTLGSIVVDCGGYILVGISFLVFIKLNGGIVVGDRSAHTAVVHLPQLFYFALFFSALGFPHVLPNTLRFLHLVNRHRLTAMAITLVMMIIVHTNTLAHPYLLADNRHLTFYLWRRLLVRHWTVKYLLVPVYMFAGWSVGRCLDKASLVLRLVLPMCLVASLVPQALLEFRYFILPFYMVRLQVKPNCLIKLFVELVALVFVNVAVFYMFLYRPFKWDSEPKELQRFMW